MTVLRNRKGWFKGLLVYALVVIKTSLDQRNVYVNAQTCTDPVKTLSTNCGDVCSTYQPCLAFNASAAIDCDDCTSDADDVCTYRCFTVDSKKLVFLIPFNDSTTATKTQSDQTDKYQWVSSALISSIGTIELADSTTEIIFAGGTDYETIVPGEAVDVTFNFDLSSNTVVKKFSLISFNLFGRTSALAPLLPPNVESLNFTNCKIYTMISLTKFDNLEELSFAHNSFPSIGSNDAISSLKRLDLQDNEIVSFEAIFTSVETLNLMRNNFTEIPTYIFAHSTLQHLYMEGNPLESASFTTTQAKFLQALSTFDLTDTSFSTPLDCDTSKQVKVHELTVCVTDYSASDWESDNSNDNSTVLIIVIVCAVVVVVGLIFGVWLWRRRKAKEQKDDMACRSISYMGLTASTSVGGTNTRRLRKQDTPNNMHMSILWVDADLARWRVDSDDIQDIERIGYGGHGVVWRVLYRKTQVLASKRIQQDHTAQEHMLDFVDEIKLVAQFQHQNIVRFVGVAWTMANDLQALFEFMPNGDLREHLLDPQTPLDWNVQKLQIAIDIAQALVYVHSFHPPLVHRDLKSRNVLLSEDMTAKLTDFGVARFRSDADTMTVGIGTSRWLAPEVISGSTSYGPEADIFSFGVVLSELDTHSLPYDDVRNAAGEKLANVAILQKVAHGTLTPSFRASCPLDLRALADQCLSLNPEDRPNAPEAAYQLRKLMKTLHSYVI